MIDWALVESSFFASKFKRFKKKHCLEAKAVLNNLDTYLTALQAGAKAVLIQAGFIHREPQGVVAIDQKGAQGKPKQTRLYVYVVEMNNTLHLITIGDKNSQQRDLADCRKYVTALRKDGIE